MLILISSACNINIEHLFHNYEHNNKLNILYNIIYKTEKYIKINRRRLISDEYIKNRFKKYIKDDSNYILQLPIDQVKARRIIEIAVKYCKKNNIDYIIMNVLKDIRPHYNEIHEKFGNIDISKVISEIDDDTSLLKNNLIKNNFYDKDLVELTWVEFMNVFYQTEVSYSKLELESLIGIDNVIFYDVDNQNIINSKNLNLPKEIYTIIKLYNLIEFKINNKNQYVSNILEKLDNERRNLFNIFVKDYFSL